MPVLFRTLFLVWVVSGVTAQGADWLSSGQDVDKGFPLSKEEQDATRITALDGDTFFLRLGVGSGWHGLNVFTMDAVGACRFVALPDGKKSVVIAFTGTADFRKAVIAQILDHGIGTMGKSYSAAVADGSQWILHFGDAHGSKTIYLDNFFPKPVVTLTELVNAEVDRNALAHPEAKSTTDAGDWRKLNSETWALMHADATPAATAP